jgi:hypothetical protein
MTVPEASIEQDPKVEKTEVVEVKGGSTPSNAEQQPEPSTDSADANWKAFREARKRDRIEKEAAERRAAEKEAEVAALKAAMEAAFAKEDHRIPSGKVQAHSGGYEDDETEDQRIERKVQAALALKEEQQRQYQLQMEQKEYPNRLSRDYPDFGSIVNEENLDYLEYHYPEIARPLKRQTECYDKWADIYHALKRFVPNSTSSKRDAARAESNFIKPKSTSSAGLSQSQDMRPVLTEERKRANWERMQRSLKGV